MSKYRINKIDGQFGTIYADPPWMLRTGGVKRKLHYDTMTTEEICKIPVGDWCLSGAHLWLWTTNPHLPEAFEVIKAWGFEYKTTLTWDKQLIGLGWWLRSRTEHLIWAVRPGAVRQNPGNLSTLISSKRRKHSQKPDEIYPIIERLSPGPYLELFARDIRPNWTSLVSDAAPIGNPYGTGHED